MPENVPYAREVLNAFPATPTPATDYYVRVDGRIQHYISDLAAPYTLRPVTFNAGESGTGAPPTDVTRTGALTSTQTYGSLSSVRQRFRPTVNIPVTGVQVDQINVSGNAAVAFHDLTTGTWVGAAAASQVGAGITAPLDALLLAGHEYFIDVGTLGAGVNGTEYTGFVSGVTLSSGHAWTGLALTAPPTVFESATPVSAGAQLAFQLLTGDMTGFDPSGMTIRGTAPVAVDYDAEARTYTVGLSGGEPVLLTRTGGPASSQPNQYTEAAYAILTPTRDVRLARYTIAFVSANATTSGVIWESTDGGLTGQIVAQVGGVQTNAGAVADVLLPTPLLMVTGRRYYVGVAGGISGVLWARFDSGSPWDWDGFTLTTARAFRDPSADIFSFPVLSENAEPDTLDLQLYEAGSGLGINAIGGLPEALDSKADTDAVAALDGRVTALEARPTLSAEYVQDVVGAMIPGGTYDDAAGTYTLPPDQTLTPEQVQDIVGAFIAAGTNATVTYDDAANTLTISATGGGGGTSAPRLSAGRALVDRTGDPTTSNTDMLGSSDAATPLDLNFTVLGDISFDQITAKLGNSYAPAGTLSILKSTDGGSSYATVATASIAGGASGVRTLTLSATVTAASGHRIRVRIAGPDGNWDLVGASSTLPTLPAAGAYSLLSYTGASADNTKYPLIEFRTSVVDAKGVIGPGDPADVPKVTNVADIPNGGQALLISSMPPRWVYRHTDGTPYYGPVYSTTP